MIFLATLLLSMFVTIVLIPILKELAKKINAMDNPSERKIHQNPMPKTGGIAMAFGVFIPVLLWAPLSGFIRATMLSAWIILLFGLLDDIKNLGYRTKFVGQIAAALIAILFGGIKIKTLGMLLPAGMLLPEWLSIPLTLVVIVGVTNAINLSDGLDGLAGGITLLSFICIGYLAYLAALPVTALICVAIVGAIFGFLRFNTYPATVFMGDAGSQLLGFFAITLSLHLTQGNSPVSPLLPIILLGFPILDTVDVMFERVANGKSPFVADKSHFHHKLMSLGFYHTEAVLVIYFLQAFLVTSAFVFRFYSEWFLLIFYLVFCGIILCFFYIAQKTGWKRRRYHIFDKVIKGRLRVFKEHNILIKFSFRIVAFGVPSLMLLTCLLPRSIPTYFSFVSMTLLAAMLVSWTIRNEWTGGLLRLPLYLSIPFIVYLSETEMVSWMTREMFKAYNFSFGAIFIFVILTLKFTRRQKGFKSTPMDFLILFIALVVPNLPDENIQRYHMGLVAAKIIGLYFSYEVLIGELRVDLNRIGLTTALALVILSFRGFIG